MQIINKKISELVPYENNAKKHPPEQIKKIAASITAFGWGQPIVVDQQGIIIVGHARFEAAKKLGLLEVPCLVVGLNEDQAKAYRLADNKLNESEWDLELVFEELKNIDEELIPITGFDEIFNLDFEPAEEGNAPLDEESGKQFKDQMVTCPECEHSFNIKV